jgi:hypothetical protein
MRTQSFSRFSISTRLTPELRATIEAERRGSFRVVDPQLISIRVEDVFDLALVLVLLDEGSLVDDLQFPPGVAQAFPQCREIAVDRGPSDLAQGPELEALNDGFIDSVERQIAHRLKFEKLLVVAFVELDRPRLSGMLDVDTGIELRLKLLERRYSPLFFLYNSDLPLDQLQTVGGRESSACRSFLRRVAAASRLIGLIPGNDDGVISREGQS